ncbi:MAG: hypothetical protein PHQ75_09630 [Thermoguttaceae bacterium]|nr:hypothetical protein [Thermoguttaceae bacterium]
MNLTGIPDTLRDYLPEYDQWNIRFDMPVQNGMEYVSRTHPLVEGLADYIVNTALDRVALDPLAKRCGVIRTNAVAKRTTLILLRYRFHLIRQRGKETIPLLAEDVQVVGFEGAPEKPVWLSPEKVQIIPDAHPSGNILPEMAKKRIQEVLDHYSDLRNDLDEFVRLRAEQLRDAHLRVRTALNNSQKIDVQPELPPDLMGIYVCLPE